MKKYIGVISGIMFALSIGVASAQFGAGAAGCIKYEDKCTKYDPTGQCLATQKVCVQTGTISVGTSPVGGTGSTGGTRPGSTATPPINGNQGGTIVRGQAQRQSTTADLSFVTNLLAQAGGIIAMLPKILLGVAVIIFFFNVIKYFITEVPDEKNMAVKRMGYSLAAIFVMVTLWGIIAFFGDAIGISSNVTVNAPALPR